MSAPTSGSRCALVITFDRFPASILGCYGNEWIETPQADRLAAEGLVADQCYAARIGPATAEEAFGTTTCLAVLKSQAVRTLLFQEADSQIDFTAAGFERREFVSGELGPTAKPDRIPLANLARSAAAAWTKEQTAGQSCLVWIHALGLTIPAFPPAGFADLYQDEFEDREVKFDAMSEEERWHHPSTTAGMASLLDHWLGHAWAAMGRDESATGPMLAVLTAAQGSPWHPGPKSFGVLDELRNPSVHVPFIAHSRHESLSTLRAGLRTAELLSTRVLGSLLAGWFRSLPWDIPSKDWIETASSSGGVRITTPAWGAIFPSRDAGRESGSPADQSLSRASSETARPVLFSKPEDFWEVNNLAEVSPEVVEELRRTGDDV